jgi:hypothetical protein
VDAADYAGLGLLVVLLFLSFFGYELLVSGANDSSEPWPASPRARKMLIVSLGALIVVGVLGLLLIMLVL